MLALMRSATSAAIPTIKREGSDSALFSTAAKAESNSMSVKQRSTSLARSVSMVDLRDTKATKKAKVEEELKDAISALRKPNRNVVGQAMAEAAERKTSTLLSAKSKSRMFINHTIGNTDRILQKYASQYLDLPSRPMFLCRRHRQRSASKIYSESSQNLQLTLLCLPQKR